MSRTTIAAMLAMLLALAPAASARPIDSGYPAYPSPEVAAKPKVMSERITDTYYSTKGNANVANATTRALAQEQAYSTYGAPVSTPKQSPAPVAADDDGEPWALIGAGFLAIALVVGAGVALVAKPRRARVAV